MDLKQVQYFIALFEDGSVTRAARRLNIVQPALSMQIARLEAELHQQLFERGAQGMKPTAAARQMYRLFLPIMRDIAHAREQLVQRDEVVTGHVSIGMIASVTESVLSTSLSLFAARYPQVEVTVMDGYSTTLIDAVAGGQLDAAIINRPRERTALELRPVLDEAMVLAVSARCGPALPERIELASLPDLELVLPTKRHGLRTVLDSHAEQDGFSLSPRFEIDSLSSLVRFVESTRYVTILPGMVVRRAVQAGGLRGLPLAAPRMMRHIMRITHPRRPLNPAAEALMEIVAAEIARVAGPPVVGEPVSRTIPNGDPRERR